MSEPSTVTIDWSHGSATVSPLAAMLVDASFMLGERTIRPFASAPWDPSDAAVTREPGHIRALGGEFVCLPFGSAGVPHDADTQWTSMPAALNSPPHGTSADAIWAVEEHSTDRVRLALDLPAPSPVSRLERTIRAVAGEAALDFELMVWARHPHRTSLGVHPIFRLPEPGETLRIDADFERGMTYPGSIDGGTGEVAPDSSFNSLDAVPAREGGTVSIAELPFAPRAEEIVQLVGARSPVSLVWSAGYRLELHWDAQILPSVLLWISDRGIEAPPWSGRYRGIGVEPIASAFDLPSAVSVADNPVSRTGHATAVDLTPDAPLTISYRIAAKDTT